MILFLCVRLATWLYGYPFPLANREAHAFLAYLTATTIPFEILYLTCCIGDINRFLHKKGGGK